MSLVYDIFTTILQFADIHTAYQLSYVDKTLHQLSFKIKPEISIIYKYKHIYNPNIKSDVLNEFLNDISGNDDEYLKLIQKTFGSLLNNTKQIIYLTGGGNGKSTFMYLINKIFNLERGYVAAEIQDLLYEPGKIFLIPEDDNINNMHDTSKIQNTTIFINNMEFVDDHVTTIKFKTQYYTMHGNNHVYPLLKKRDLNMIEKFDDTVISAFFNFLLDGI
jgi:hypothetical protein